MTKACNLLTVKEASDMIGRSQEYVRSLVASGLVPRCGAFQKEGAKRMVYHINKAEFERFIGAEQNPVDKTGF